MRRQGGLVRYTAEELIGVLEISRKQDVHIRLDSDILHWFKGQGRGYQTRINAVLRAFVENQKKSTA